MSERPQRTPYQSLGNTLKRVREKCKETLAEVSGAVEIDVQTLEYIEAGHDRPSEDILLLLISHFGMREDEASELWDLAGYDQSVLPFPGISSQEDSVPKQSIIILPVDNRISYTDTVHVMVNNYGVVMNFMQGAGQAGQPMVVARLGMSREHAQSVLDLLKRTLEQSEQKSLPAPNNKQQRQRKTDK